MKFITSSSLLALLPSATNAATTTAASLRGTAAAASSSDFEIALFNKQEQRDLQDTCEGAYFKEDTYTTCCMPEELDHSLLTANKELKAYVRHATASAEGEIAYWNIKFDNNVDGGNLAGLDLTGWCVDRSRSLAPGSYTFDVFSTYDDWNYDEALDEPERLVNVNWMINNYRINDKVVVPQEFISSNPSKCTGRANPMTVEWNTYQNAVWATIDRMNTTTGYILWQTDNPCLRAYLIQEADTKGNGFEPDCKDPKAEVAVILMVDDDATTNKDKIKKQVIIGEVKLAALKAKYPNACKPQQCCEELVVNHQLFQENKEINVTFSSGSTPGDWNVVFNSGSSIYPAQQFKGWSVDLDRPDFNGTFPVDTYSVYDNFYRFNVIDKKENVEKVNYLINKLPVGTSVSCGAGGTFTVTKVDFQNAVWDLMDTKGQATDRGSPNACVVSELVRQANENGATFEPSCNAESSDKIAILLIVDDGTAKVKVGKTDYQIFEVVTNQVIVAEVPLSSVPGSCIMKNCNCCHLETPTPTLPPIVVTNEVRDGNVTGGNVTAGSCPPPFNILGSKFGAHCGHKGVKLIHSSKTGASSPALRIDILDTIMGIYLTPGSEEVSFRVQNPFAGQGSLEIYVQYEGAENHNINCDAEKGVGECQFHPRPHEAACLVPKETSIQPFTVVTVYFVDRGTKLFPVSYTNNVTECCEPGPITTSDSVMSYTFEILCSCPEGENAFTRE